MGYKGKDDRGKGKRRVHERLIGNSRQKTAKQIMGENRCTNISFRPLTGYCQKKKIKLGSFQNTEFMPVLERTQPMGNKRIKLYLSIVDSCNFDLKISENEKIFLVFADF